MLFLEKLVTWLRMPSFYNGKRFFLTYPRTDREPQALVEFLQSKADILYYVVAKELHEDGMPHLHACVEFAEHYRGNVSSFDWDGRHPNKQDPRKWNACIQYTKKGGEYVEGPAERIAKAEVAKLDYAFECAKHTTMEAWYGWCIDKKISIQYAKFFWSRVHEDNITITGNDHDGQVCDALNGLAFNESWKTLVLIGPSGVGKTTWAKRVYPKPALFVSHIDALRGFRVGYHKSIIFDDVDVHHYPRTSQIHLVDYHNPRHIHCRHVVAFIPEGVHKVFTANVDPLSLSDSAIRRRVHVIRMPN